MSTPSKIERSQPRGEAHATVAPLVPFPQHGVGTWPQVNHVNPAPCAGCSEWPSSGWALSEGSTHFLCDDCVATLVEEAS